MSTILTLKSKIQIHLRNGAQSILCNDMETEISLSTLSRVGHELADNPIDAVFEMWNRRTNEVTTYATLREVAHEVDKQGGVFGVQFPRWESDE